MRLAAASSRIASRQREFSDARYRASGTCSASPCPTTTSAPPSSSTAPATPTPPDAATVTSTAQGDLGPIRPLVGPQQSYGGDLVPGSTASGLRDRPPVERSTAFVVLVHLPGEYTADTGRSDVGQSPRDPGELASLADLGHSRGWRNTPRSPRPPACRSASAIRIAPASAGATLHQFVKRSELAKSLFMRADWGNTGNDNTRPQREGNR